MTVNENKIVHIEEIVEYMKKQVKKADTQKTVTETRKEVRKLKKKC